MEREILFRGKSVVTGEWVEGYYNKFIVGSNPVSVIIPLQSLVKVMAENVFIYQVDPTTVVQYTGLKDKNGVKIFEGDNISFDGGKHQFVVSFIDFSWYATNTELFPLYRYRFGFHLEPETECEVIGSIHDNPPEGDNHVPL